MKRFLYEKAFFHVDLGSNYDAPLFTRMCVASPRWCIEKALKNLNEAFLDETVKDRRM